MDKFSRNIYLIRHAESFNNIDDIKIYIYNAKLTEKGLLQSKVIPSCIEDIELIVHSKLERTYQTASDTIIQYPEAMVQMWNVHEFNYLGEDKFAFSEKKKRRKAKARYWEKDDMHYSNNQNAETFCGFLMRVEEIVQKINHLDVGNIAIFTHKYFIKGICWHLLIKEKDIYYSPKRFKEFCDSCIINPKSIIKIIASEKKIFLDNK